MGFSKVIRMRCREFCIDGQAAFGEFGRVGIVAISGAILPAAPDDTQPLESKGSNRRMMAFSSGSEVLVAALGPGTLVNRRAGKFVEALADELRTTPTQVHPMLEPATPCGDRGNARSTLQRSWVRKSFPARTTGGQQPWSQGGPCAGQTGKDGLIGMGRKKLLDLPVILRDGWAQAGQLLGQRSNEQDRRTDDRFVFGEGYGRGGQCQPPGDETLPPTVVPIIEGPQGRCSDPLQRPQRGPLEKKIRGQAAAQILSGQLERLWKSAFERSGELVEQLGAQIDKLTTRFDQSGQFARRRIVGQPDRQAVAMMQKQLQQQGRIGPVILGATGSECFPKAGQALRINGIKHQVGVATERKEQRSTRLLQSNGDGLGAKALLELCDPGSDGFRSVLHRGVFEMAAVGLSQTDIMFMIGPVDANQCGEGGCSAHSCREEWFGARWLWLSEGLIAETLAIGILSIRFEPKRGAGSEGLSQNIPMLGRGNSSSQRCVTGPETADKVELFPRAFCFAAKLFTVGCGELIPDGSPRRL